MNAPRVILIEPQNPANVGFIARLLANFGLSDWVLVGAPELVASDAERTGAAALDTLAAARRADNLADALRGCSCSIAFTARAGKHRQPVVLPKLRLACADWLGGDATPALVFGREDRGLETEEVEQCSFICTIPTLGLESMNLSHAVGLVLYEWHRDIQGDCGGFKLPDYRDQVWASAEDRARVMDKALKLIAASGFPDRGDELAQCWRRISSIPIEARDLRTVERVIRHSDWLDKSSSST